MTKFNTETETYCDPNYYRKKSMAFFFYHEWKILKWMSLVFPIYVMASLPTHLLHTQFDDGLSHLPFKIPSPK